MSETLAIKYRPKTFDEVVEQGSIKLILSQQLQTKEIKNAYLFVGSAGTGKTTSARIFANEINQGQGSPIELDAASHNGVDDVRGIIQQAQTQSINSEYKVFIIDECHAISSQGWQAFLKLLEEPPAKSIFIFCTTDPQKIPKTILSRVQRYDFKRISQPSIVSRLRYVCDRELTKEDDLVRLEALEYIARIADGGMRDALSLLDKCISYSREITLGNVISALGVADYDIMSRITDACVIGDDSKVISEIETMYSEGMDIKRFIRQYLNFLIDVIKYRITNTIEYTTLPASLTDWIKKLNADIPVMEKLMDTVLKLNADVKYDSSPKYLLESALMLYCMERNMP